MSTLYVSLSAHVETADQAARIAETLARAAVGFALDGLPHVSISVTNDEDDEDEGDDEDDLPPDGDDPRALVWRLVHERT